MGISRVPPGRYGLTVLLDSSVLMQAQRMPDSEAALHLRQILASGEAVVTGPVVMEYIKGAKTREELDLFTQFIVSIDYLDTDQPVWLTAGQLSNRLLRSGLTLTDADVIIAATAIRHNVPLYTFDKGFNRIPDLRLYQPSSALT